MQLETLPTAKHMTISHAAARFEIEGHDWDGLTKFEAVILGDVKQRLMWPPFETRKPNEPARPMCKSSDNVTGYPQATFPWDDSRNGLYALAKPLPTALDCDSCMFAKNPRSSKANGLPVCESNYQLLLLDKDQNVVILRLHGAAKNEMSHYREWFKKNKNALFMFNHELELTAVKNNGKRYANLRIIRKEQTPREKWVSEYLPLFKQWRGELQVPPSTVMFKPKTELPELDMA